MLPQRLSDSKKILVPINRDRAGICLDSRYEVEPYRVVPGKFQDANSGTLLFVTISRLTVLRPINTNGLFN